MNYHYGEALVELHDPLNSQVVVPPDDYVAEQERCWGTGTHGGPCPHRAETDVGLCLECRDEIKARVD